MKLHHLATALLLWAAVSTGSAFGQQTQPPDPPSLPAVALQHPVHGQEAIDALADKLPGVARFHGMSPEQLRERLRTDSTLWVAPSGHLFYADTALPDPDKAPTP